MIAGVATVPGATAPLPKRTETAQLDPIAATQRGGDLPEERRDDDSHLALGEVRVGLGQPRNEFRSGHVIGAPPQPTEQKPRRCRTPGFQFRRPTERPQVIMRRCGRLHPGKVRDDAQPLI